MSSQCKSKRRCCQLKMQSYRARPLWSTRVEGVSVIYTASWSIDHQRYNFQFGGQILFNDDDNPVLKNGAPPRENFDNPGMSMISIFIVAVGDDWNQECHWSF